MDNGIEYILSQSLDDTSWVLQLVCSREGMPSQVTLTDLRSGLMQTSWNSEKPSIISCIWVEETPLIHKDWRMNEPWGEGPGDISGQRTGHESLMCTWSPESKRHCGLHKKRCCQQVKGGDFPPPSALARAHMKCLTLEEVAQSCGYLCPGSVQGQAGRSFDPDLVKDALAHSMTLWNGEKHCLIRPHYKVKGLYLNIP